jgi:hypothetical protein
MAKITQKAMRCVAVVRRLKPQRGQAPGLAKIVAPHPMHLMVSIVSPLAQDQVVPIVVHQFGRIELVRHERGDEIIEHRGAGRLGRIEF